MFRFYSDPALTVPLSEGYLTTFIGAAGVEPIPMSIWFGSPWTGSKLQAVDGGSISVSIVDLGPVDDFGVAAVRLALLESDLELAIPGSALVLGATIQGGVAHAVQIWMAAAGDLPAGRHGGLELVTNSLIESTGSA